MTETGIVSGDGSPAPIFVGGTGRSGTTVTGRLLGQHPRYVVLPVEMKYHADPRGLPGVFAGTTTAHDFRERMLTTWDVGWQGRGDKDRIPGLGRVVERPALEQALDTFVDTVDEQGVRAAQVLMRTVHDGYARRNGADGWVEMTPRNVQHAAFVQSVAPDARLVNVIRDGRDVVASLLRLNWASDPFEALTWWETRMRRAHVRILRANPEQSFVLNFDRLAVHDRERAFSKLVTFLGWGDVPEVRAYFDSNLTAERAHFGAWRSAFEPAVAERLDQEYVLALERLDAAGVACP